MLGGILNASPRGYTGDVMKRRKRIGYGHFLGKVRVDWDDKDPRKMILVSDVVYIDCRDKRWTAKAGRSINGASSGWFFRRLFPAYVGWYRRSTVIHDVAYENKVEPSWEVHRMFREGSICDGTIIPKAWFMWFCIRIWSFVFLKDFLGK